MESQKKLKRPPTPRVAIGNTDNQNAQVIVPKNRKELIFKNFSNFMRQIVDNQNENFLNGSLNIFDYLLAKYLEVPVNDIQKLEKIQIQINGDYGLLNQFGERLISLKILKLNNSFIQSVSDVGSFFKNLKILEMNSCKLKDLSGLICFEQLQIFTAKNNVIDDLIELEMCSSLEQIDFENNLIQNEDNLYFLSSLDKLKSINLKGNPISNYANKLKELIPSLETIDEELNLEDIEQSLISFEPSLPPSSSGNVSSANVSHSTNENSSEFSNEQSKTKSNFYSKKNQLEDDKNISISNEINMNQTMSEFKFSKNKLAPIKPTLLKPVIMKKEEDVGIKDLRESIQIPSPGKEPLSERIQQQPKTTVKKEEIKITKIVNHSNKPAKNLFNSSQQGKNLFLSHTGVKKKLDKVIVNKGPVKGINIFSQSGKPIMPQGEKK